MAFKDCKLYAGMFCQNVQTLTTGQSRLTQLTGATCLEDLLEQQCIVHITNKKIYGTMLGYKMAAEAKGREQEIMTVVERY